MSELKKIIRKETIIIKKILWNLELFCGKIIIIIMIILLIIIIMIINDNNND